MAFIPNLDPVVTITDTDEYVVRQGAEDKRVSHELLASTIIDNSGKNFWRENLIVDGKFDFWLEGTSQTSFGYGSDTMWSNEQTGSTKVHTQGTLATGVDLPSIDNPTTKYFSRTTVTSVAAAGNSCLKVQNMEDVATLSGKTVSLSFYAKADGNKDIAVDLIQHFGTGGSPSATVTGIGTQKVTLNAGWSRYEVQISIPTIVGKVRGSDNNDYLGLYFWFDAGSDFDVRTDSLGQQSGVFDLTCIQLEDSLESTPFQELSLSFVSSQIDRFYREYNTIYAQVAQFTVNNLTFVGFIEFSRMRQTPAVFFTAFNPISLTATPRLTQTGTWTFIVDEQSLVPLLTLDATNTATAATVGLEGLILDARF